MTDLLSALSKFPLMISYSLPSLSTRLDSLRQRVRSRSIAFWFLSEKRRVSLSHLEGRWDVFTHLNGLSPKMGNCLLQIMIFYTLPTWTLAAPALCSSLLCCLWGGLCVSWWPSSLPTPWPGCGHHAGAEAGCSTGCQSRGSCLEEKKRKVCTYYCAFRSPSLLPDRHTPLSCGPNRLTNLPSASSDRLSELSRSMAERSFRFPWSIQFWKETEKKKRRHLHFSRNSYMACCLRGSVAR